MRISKLDVTQHRAKNLIDFSELGHKDLFIQVYIKVNIVHDFIIQGIPYVSKH